MAKRSTKKSTAKATTTSEAKATVERDAYGASTHSQRGQINAALDLRKARTVEEVMEATGLGRSRVVTHIRFMVQNEWAKPVGDGWKLLKPKAK